jgi:MoaA/NifB/PqqE/SkfB family radical SAM enzyme
LTKPVVEIWLELETRCNLHCKFCYNFWKDGTAPPPDRLGTGELIEGLSRLLAAVECQKLAVSGGEPLLREDLFEILACLRARRVPVALATNSTLLDRQKIESLIRAGVATFQVPLHSISEQMHDALCGVRCWRKTLASIVMLKEAGAHVVAVFVATRLNLGQFPQVLELCGLLGLGEVIFNRFVPGGLGLLNQSLIGVPGDGELLEVLAAANERARGLGMDIHLGVPVAVPGIGGGAYDRLVASTCPVGVAQSKWTVDCAGSIRRCNHTGESIGNLLNGGVEKLLEELRAPAGVLPPGDIRPCGFLGGAKLFQLQRR